MTIAVLCSLLCLCVFLLGYRAGWLDKKDHDAARYIVSGGMALEAPEWARRRTSGAE